MTVQDLMKADLQLRRCTTVAEKKAALMAMSFTDRAAVIGYSIGWIHATKGPAPITWDYLLDTCLEDA